MALEQHSFSRGIGLMSGSSLDGLDIAACEFRFDNEWHYQIYDAITIPFPDPLLKRLSQSPEMNARELWHLHTDFGHFMGVEVKQFLQKTGFAAQFVASHGHTVLHQPQLGFTCQIGDGAAIAIECGLPVVNDFRSSDVALGGQGAPLVPVGDDKLFYYVDACLNLGGFANISFRNEKCERIAFDICPCNLALNHIALQAGFPFDDKGMLAKQGVVLPFLLESLNQLAFYSINGAKSLSREWFKQEFLRIIDNFNASANDKLATVTQHIALQVTKSYLNKRKKILVTGGGAFNVYLIKKLEESTQCELILPDEKVIQFKEALIFAFLGLLRLREEENCWASVTGAKRNSCGGSVYLP